MKDVGLPHLLHVFSTFVPAGPEMRTVRLINALGGTLRHSILSMDGRTEARLELDGGAPVDVLESLPRAGSARTVLGLRALLGGLEPDLVLSYNWGAFDSVLATGSLGWRGRHIHHEDGFNADEAERFKGRRIWARRLLLGGVARVVVPSEVLARVARERWHLPSHKLELIPNGIDMARFSGDGKAEALRAELGIEERAPVVGFVGHLRPVKNPQRLLEAFATVELGAGRPPAHLVLLGKGPEREGLRQAATGLGLGERVHLAGHRSETAPWYRLFDLFALSSDSEQMPVALLEAMAAGLPVVSTDVGDVRRMLPAAQGEFVVALEARGLGRAMGRLLDDPELSLQLGRANRARAREAYTFERMLARYRELYHETLRGPAR